MMEPLDYVKRDVADLRCVVARMDRELTAVKISSRFVIEETLCTTCGCDYDQPFIVLREHPHTCPLCIGLKFAVERRVSGHRLIEQFNEFARIKP